MKNLAISRWVKGIAILVLIFFVLALWAIFNWKESQVPPSYPNEGQLEDGFRAKRDVFTRIQEMAFEDSSKFFRVGKTDLESSGLPADRLHEYRDLLSSIQPGLVLLRDANIAKFVYANGGSSYVTGPQWSNGIEYISTDAQGNGEVIKSSKEIDLKKEAIYLIPIEDHWFIFHEQD